MTLRARHVLPVGSPPVENGWIRIEGGRIAAIGRRRPPESAVDLGDAIILPGLVNAHVHLEFSDLATPLPCEGGLPDWIGRVVAMRRSRRPGPAEHERLRRAIEAGLRESAAAGVTSVGEIATAPHPPSSAAIGPRITVFREAIGLSTQAVADGHGALVRDLDRPSGFDLGVSPHAPYSVAAPLGRLLVKEARRRRLPMAMHLAESRAEAELLATGGGLFRRLLEDLGAWDASRPPRLLSLADWISLLARSPRGLVVHGTFLPDDAAAFSRLARHRDRLAVVVCPRTTRALSGVLPPVRAFRSAGIRVAIGTDGRASNPDLAVLAECRTLVDAGLATPTESIAMATRHGAWALGRERTGGALAPGRPADLAILRPAAADAEPHEAAVDPGSRIVAVLRSGRLIAGEAGDASATAGSWRCSSR